MPSALTHRLVRRASHFAPSSARDLGEPETSSVCLQIASGTPVIDSRGLRRWRSVIARVSIHNRPTIGTCVSRCLPVARRCGDPTGPRWAGWPDPPYPKILAILPTNSDLLPAPAERDSRERFGLRECGTLQVRAYDKNAEMPSLSYETGEEYPRSLYHLRNVLAFQAVAVGSDHV